MALTDREQELLKLIQASPLSTPEDLARQLGTSRAAVNVHVSSLVRKGALLGRGYILPDAQEAPRIVVVGGANMDLKARTSQSCVLATSNPGMTTQTPGGVARNVAENLGRLRVPVSLVSAVGRDVLGDALLRETEAAGVEVRGVLRVPDEPTGTYTAVLDETGELVVAVAAMGVMDRLSPAALRERRGLLRGASWIVADGNLRQDTLLLLLELSAEAGVQVAFEPVSVPKAAQLRPALKARRAPALITPNVAELAALLERTVPDTPGDLRTAALELHDQGVDLIWIRRGALGSLVSTPDGAQTLPALPAALRDVTGAGDAMLAAFLAALVAGLSPTEAARHGHAAAALTIESPFTVVPDLSPETLRARLTSA
ncbi:PfkB family carbohydrate kinase [Deinococcus deserti]|uniref:Putative carbohydrate kinase, PfkB family protein n=1 Tax=Deinococcus deserti (strain DSM 17065 / CIP 109153 / LMG 22923 / VCD115) TaxID=546414 RepID=C1CY51_DEIDV|nr:PfkB family carbohydrate kinase [Deinococcus deserti]ACO47007.1 putative carbohydrate kinase, PfkB family protein [Deinococcus deserti VCD115]